MQIGSSLFIYFAMGEGFQICSQYSVKKQDAALPTTTKIRDVFANVFSLCPCPLVDGRLMI